MKSEKDLKNYNIRTDLLVDVLSNNTKKDGILLEEKELNNIKITSITISKKNNSLNKSKGKYITISYQDITDKENFKNIENILIKELKKMLEYLKISFNSKALIIGLGNRESTPDSLGPKVIDNILVTRYLYDIEKIEVDPNYRNVSAFIPGVTGNTGIESSDVIKGLIEKTHPDFLIIIDALASSSMERINKTIQITDTGINPGSGVYNNRGELSKKTLGIPVISIGVPTVIEAFVLVSDTIRYLLKNLSYNKNNFNKNKLVPAYMRNYSNHNSELSIEEKRKVLGEVGILDEAEVKELIYEVLTPIGYNMMITPKEIDFIIDKTSRLISEAINKTLHKKFDI